MRGLSERFDSLHSKLEGVDFRDPLVFPFDSFDISAFSFKGIYKPPSVNSTDTAVIQGLRSFILQSKHDVITPTTPVSVTHTEHVTVVPAGGLLFTSREIKMYPDRLIPIINEFLVPETHTELALHSLFTNLEILLSERPDQI